MTDPTHDNRAYDKPGTAYLNQNPRFDLLRKFLGVTRGQFVAMTRSASPVLTIRIPFREGGASVIEFTGPEMLAAWERGAAERNAR